MKINKKNNSVHVEYEGDDEEMSIRDFVCDWDCFDGFVSVTSEEIVDQYDHSTSFEQIIKHEPSDTFFKIEWDAPRWEDSISPDDLHYSISEVKPVEKTIIVYE